MPSTLTSAQMKQFVRDHFEDFVNRQNASVIHKNFLGRTPGAMIGRESLNSQPVAPVPFN